MINSFVFHRRKGSSACHPLMAGLDGGMLSLLFFAFFSLYATSFLMAQNRDDDESDLISSLSITGLKRTRLSTAERPLKKFIGLRSDQVDMDEVTAVVLATGILEPILIEINGPVLSVTVREKWSIFLVPVFFISSGWIMAGLAYYDANAFGRNDKYYVTGIYQANGWVASTGYMHPSPGRPVPGWNFMAIYSRDDRYDRDQNNDDLRYFGLDSISLSTAINFPLLEDSELLNVSGRFSFNQKNLREKENALNGPEGDLRLFGAGTDLAFKRSSWDGFLLSQEQASLAYFYKTTFESFSYHSISFRGTWEKSLVPGFRLNLRTGLVFQPEAPVLFESSPFSAQVAILPLSFSARNYAGVSAGLEKYILKISAGTLSIAAAYQLVYSRGSVLKDSLDHGCMGMLTFYLSQLAIPAFGLGVAYNVKENYLQGSFSLGMSF